MKKVFLLLVSFLILISSVSAIPWCGNQDLFFWNSTSDIPTYRILNNIPELANQNSLSVSVSSGTGERILGNWTSPLGSPGITTLEPGLWRFRTYARATAESGITTLKFYAINRSASGVETNLFYGNAITQDINAGPTPTEYLTSYARRNYTTFFPGDRLVIRINGSATTSGVRTIYMDVAGNTNASMVSMGYFDCPSSGGAGAIAGAEGEIILYGLIGGAIGGAALFLLYKRRKP